MQNFASSPRYQRDIEDLTLVSGCPHAVRQSFCLQYLLRDINHGFDAAQDNPAGSPQLICAVRL